MKLATLKNGCRDGALVVVARDLTTAAHAGTIARPCSRRLSSGAPYSPPCRRFMRS